jgi:hypothetical protein
MVLGGGRIVCAAPDVVTALRYDIAAAREDPAIADGSSAGHLSLPATGEGASPEAEDERL